MKSQSIVALFLAALLALVASGRIEWPLPHPDYGDTPGPGPAPAGLLELVFVDDDQDPTLGLGNVKRDLQWQQTLDARKISRPRFYDDEDAFAKSQGYVAAAEKVGGRALIVIDDEADKAILTRKLPEQVDAAWVDQRLAEVGR